MRLCREMLPESPGIKEDEILAEVIGFLEACQERMFDLIEAGTQGLLSEDIFELCLRVNDAVLRTLEAEKVCAVHISYHNLSVRNMFVERNFDCC